MLKIISNLSSVELGERFDNKSLIVSLANELH